jgi:hypothetical protein
MYLSFRRSQDALLALGFFVLMVVVVFSTLLYVLPSSSRLCRLIYCIRYFIERGTWDDTIGTFINSDGDPSQFAVSLRWPRDSHIMPNLHTCFSPYQPQRGTWLHLPNSQSNDITVCRFVIVSTYCHLVQ